MQVVHPPPSLRLGWRGGRSLGRFRRLRSDGLERDGGDVGCGARDVLDASDDAGHRRGGHDGNAFETRATTVFRGRRLAVVFLKKLDGVIFGEGFHASSRANDSERNF